jgi:hypothetical protein
MAEQTEAYDGYDCAQCERIRAEEKESPREFVIRVWSKWIDAMRNGGYQQTSNVLKKLATSESAAKYCCLGIACELDATLSQDVSQTRPDTAVFKDCDNASMVCGSEAMPPQKSELNLTTNIIIEALGEQDARNAFIATLPSISARRDGWEGTRVLDIFANLNDNHSLPFGLIADAAEALLNAYLALYTTPSALSTVQAAYAAFTQAQRDVQAAEERRDAAMIVLRDVRDTLFAVYDKVNDAVSYDDVSELDASAVDNLRSIL